MAEEIVEGVLPILEINPEDDISKEKITTALKNPRKIEVVDPIDSPEFMSRFDSATHIIIRECHLKSLESLVHLKDLRYLELYYKKNVMVNLWGLGFIKNLESFSVICERIPHEAVEDLLHSLPKTIALRAINATQIKGDLKKLIIANKLPLPSIHAEDIKSTASQAQPK